MPLARRLGRMWQDDEKPGRALAVKRGDQILALDDAERERWRKITQKVVDAWVEKVSKKGHDGKALVADAKRLVAKYSK